MVLNKIQVTVQLRGLVPRVARKTACIRGVGRLRTGGGIGVSGQVSGDEAAVRRSSRRMSVTARRNVRCEG